MYKGPIKESSLSAQRASTHQARTTVKPKVWWRVSVICHSTKDERGERRRLGEKGRGMTCDGLCTRLKSTLGDVNLNVLKVERQRI